MSLKLVANNGIVKSAHIPPRVKSTGVTVSSNIPDSNPRTVDIEFKTIEDAVSQLTNISVSELNDLITTGGDWVGGTFVKTDDANIYFYSGNVVVRYCQLNKPN